MHVVSVFPAHEITQGRKIFYISNNIAEECSNNIKGGTHEQDVSTEEGCSDHVDLAQSLDTTIKPSDQGDHSHQGDDTHHDYFYLGIPRDPKQVTEPPGNLLGTIPERCRQTE